MDVVIAAAVADVRAMGGSTNTPAGQRALVAAIKRHLEQTQDTLDHAQGDAGTRAAAAQVNAANYAGIGQPTTGAGAALPQLPSVPMGGLPLGGVLAPLAGLSSMFSQGGGPQTMRNVGAESPFAGVASCSDQEGSLAAGIPVGEVRVDKIGVAPGREAYRTYIAKALDVMGITDPAARANWARGLEVGAERESGFNPMAINRVDVNAHGALLGDGAPAGCSRGGLQTIPATFASNHQPGTSTNIYDPVANIAAAMNYLMRHYHVQRDGSNLTSVGQFNPHHVPQGY
ncbi:transglycosylase SLT domain-containing protein [Mycobacterium sp. TY815]|uniref:transglycosylase SLT domain-containing protein n=1 Tax=Mycobacterium sp. TY815 TaxID=3050581 RepID=UPI002741F3C3|nr:transglycosylase SLT domain-containing protein [Mycobacterium sp. TY815]MDP7707390.1 transglycosylase SLT domain-containing protein [Mycobacterium sp. TY815]